MGGVNVWGYGLMSLGTKSQGTGSAHRVAYKLYKGEPGKLHVLHSCDNRLCVNPDHLFLGTCKDNMQDKVAKGRQQDQKGELAPHAVLSEAAVADIRTGRLKGSEFARLYNVSPQNVCDIQKRRTWTHV